VQHADPSHRYVVTYSQLRDTICTMFGGREAEVLCCEDISVGASSDLHNATQIARALVEQYGEECTELGIGRWVHHDKQPQSEVTRARIDSAIGKSHEAERARARQILTEKKQLLIALRDLLIDKKVLDRSSFAHLVT
jgi:cell division protease FtsH